VKWVVGGGFSVFYKGLKDGRMKFGPAFMLVDGSGALRAVYRTAVPDIDIIMRDIGLLKEEAHNINGPSKYAYKAAHLFLCYPK
jgi:protein SCO1